MKINLATDLKTRVGDTTKDARLKNAYVEVRGEQSVVRHRPSCVSGILTSIGVAQGGYGEFFINGDVLSNMTPSNWIENTSPVYTAWGVAGGGYIFDFPPSSTTAYKSSDNGANWTAITTPSAIAVKSYIYGEYSKAHIVLGTFAQDGYFSFNSTNWYPITKAENMGIRAIFSVADGPFGCIACDSNGKVAQFQTAGITAISYDISSYISSTIYRVFVFKGSYYGVTLADEVIKCSFFPSIWGSAKPTNLSGESLPEKGIVTTQDRIVMMDISGNIVISNDGETFFSGENLPSATGIGLWHSINYNGLYFIAVSTTGDIVISPNLSSWTLIEDVPSSISYSVVSYLVDGKPVVFDYYATSIAVMDTTRITL